MNAKHRRTLKAIFTDPVPSTISWAAVEGLLGAAGCERLEGAGSRVKFVHGQLVVALHRPHPGKEMKQYQVREIRALLIKLGVAP